MRITNNYYQNYRNTIAIKKTSNEVSTVSNPNIIQNNVKVPYVVPFLGKIKKQEDDLQLQNIRKTFDKNYVSYTQNITPGQRKLLEDFLTADNKNIKFKKNIGSNGSTYIVSNNKDTIVLKAQHCSQDGRNPNMVTRTNSPDFDNEIDKLKKLPLNINTTNLLADMKLGTDESARKVLVLSFVQGEKLSDTKQSLNKNNLQKLYSDLLELDKKQIFHRDLNAFNIMFNKDNGQLYILDYGAGKYFGEMDKLSVNAKKLYDLKKASEPKENEISKDNFIIKKEMNELINQIKYRKYDGLALSNVENFETLGLLPYLKIYSDKIVNEENTMISSADKLFLNHLQLKGKYHQERVKFLESEEYQSINKEEHIENEKIMAKALSLVDDDNVTPLTRDIANTELLRIKMANSQKVARLFVSNSEYNYKMAMYWNMDLGVTSRYAISKLENLISKYSGDKDMLEYLYLNLKIAKFYNQEIFPEVYDSVFGIAKNAITDLSASEIKGVTQTMEDGCWLDSSKRAPSNYVPKSPHNYKLLQF